MQNFQHQYDDGRQGPAVRPAVPPELGTTQGRRLRSTVPALFAAQVRTNPDAVALAFGVRRFTYQDVEERSNRIARRLLAVGATYGCRVGLFVEHDPDAVAALLAVLKIGAAYVPLDPSYPAAVLSTALRMSKAAALVTQRRLGEDASAKLGWSGAVLDLDADAAIIDAESAFPLDVSPIGPEDLAYIMFTSGSTGRPKGVMVPHRGIVRLVKDADYAVLDADQVFLLLAPLAFDASTFEIWGCLLNGGTLVISPITLPSIRDIAETIKLYGVTILWLTSGLFHLIVDQHLEALQPLKQLLAGGDVLSPVLVERARRALPACQIINGYGPTENTTFTCCYPVPKDLPVIGPIPIGRPISNTTIRILDEDLRSVRDGESGQLCTGGAGVALGYLDDPEMTARKFILDPDHPDQRLLLYLTGDLVRRRPDGHLEFLGRADRQVKINGKRIELEEIESALRACPGVRDAAVLLREDHPGPKTLVAYVCASLPSLQDLVPWRRFLRDRLPEHAIPSAFVMLDHLPLTPIGKLDRALLPPPPQAAAPADSANRDTLEAAVAAIWALVLRVPHVGTRTNFFDLGGTSLQLLDVLDQIQRSLCPTLQAAALFDHPTVTRLAAFIRGGQADPRFSTDRENLRAQRARRFLDHRQPS